MVGTTVHSAAPLTCREINVEAELGGHHNAVSRPALKRLSEKLLRHEGAISFGGIEERDTEIYRPSNERDAALAVGAAGVEVDDGLRTAAGMPLDPQADRKHLERPKAPTTRGLGTGLSGPAGHQPRSHAQYGSSGQQLAAVDLLGGMRLHVMLLRMSRLGWHAARVQHARRWFFMASSSQNLIICLMDD
jgi:hypothetical protein